MTGRGSRSIPKGSDRRRADPERRSIDFAEAGSPALRTVVAAVRAGVGGNFPPPPDARAVSTPETDPDWERVQSIARRHQVVPLVYEGLSGARDSPGVPNPPSHVLDSLREAVQFNAKRNLRRAGELARLLDAFDDAGVRAIPYKGPVLAATAYGDLGRRMFLDLDLLVHPDDVLDAGRALRSRGYCPAEGFETFRELGGDAPLLAAPVECEFHHAETDDEVELRWKLGHWSKSLDASFDDLWGHRDRTTLAGRDVPALSPVDRLVVLALHGTRHAWRRIAWLADFAAAIRVAPGLDWEAVERRAESWSSGVALRIAMLLASSVWDGLVPDRGVERALADRRAVALAERAWSWLAANPLGTPSILQEWSYNLAASDSLARSVPAAARIAFQPEWVDYRTLPLPRALWPAYVLVKAARMAKVVGENATDEGQSIVTNR